MKTHKTKESNISTKSVDPKEFITELGGFLKKGSKVPRSNPLKLKKIWRTKNSTERLWGLAAGIRDREPKKSARGAIATRSIPATRKRKT